jgi:hypothetical protein
MPDENPARGQSRDYGALEREVIYLVQATI